MTITNSTQLRLTGGLDIELYGLPIREWQSRNWGRRGAVSEGGCIVANTAWVLSAGLATEIVATPGAALVENSGGGRKLVAVHAPKGADLEAIEALTAENDVDPARLTEMGLKPGTAKELAGEYNHQLRKREAPFAINIEVDGLDAAEKALFKSSYKGVTDLVTKYVWPIPAFAVTKLCARRKISPNSVTTVSLIFCLFAFWFFWRGDWTLGFITGWLMTFLDTVDGKLARTTLTSSKWGNVYDHGIDLIHPPFWYIAWYVGLGAAAPEWAFTAIVVIVVTYVVARLMEGVFMRAHGFHIHVWEKGDSLLREVIARRNPNMLIFMIFTMFGSPAGGLAAVAIWATICVAIHVVRIFQAGFTAANPPLTSWMER